MKTEVDDVKTENQRLQYLLEEQRELNKKNEKTDGYKTLNNRLNDNIKKLEKTL